MEILEEFHKELTALFEKYDAGIAVYADIDGCGGVDVNVYTTSSKTGYIGQIETEDGSVGIDQNTTYELIKV